MKSGKVLLSVLAGVAVGALAGVLLAPDKGSVTRKKISKKGDDLVNSVKEKFDELLDNVTKKVEEVKEEVADITQKQKSSTKEAKKDAQTTTG